MRPTRSSRAPQTGRERRAGRPGGGPATSNQPDAARRVAYEALVAVHRDDAYGNIALPRLLREHRLTGRDAALATELAYGTLRVEGQLDAFIADAANRAVSAVDPPVRDALRLGAYQLLYTRVPAHAAVATTVDLVRAVAPAAAGFANAVLRRLAERDLAAWLARVAPPAATDPVGHLALVHAHPAWIVRAFADSLQADPASEPGFAELARALAADNERPRVHLCARPGRIDPADLAAQVGGTVGTYSPYAVYLPEGAPGELPVVARGLAHVQDEGSQLVALALARAPLDPAAGGGDGRAGGDGPDGAPGRPERWLDLCAGPGGKAALLGALAAQQGARVTAVEVAPHRADLVRRAVAGLPVDVLTADGRTIDPSDAPPVPDRPGGPETPARPGTPVGWDRVLVDAPCTGLGALRRRPEARWRKTAGDLPPLTKLQRELLANALRVVRPGGVVAYVTCSPHPVETRVTVAETLRRVGSAELIDARACLPADLPDLGDGPTVQLWPHRHGTDAMFLALIRRTWR
jgi:16S rRNA (cytosine967-C5)-methyltransferase